MSAGKFAFVRADERPFRGEGLRPQFVYSDLGINDATAGRVGAHVIRATRPPDGGTGTHRHTLDFQMVYILKGRVTFWYDGQGRIEMGPGDCVHQPPGIRHELIDWTADMELLEITQPAEFATHD